MVVNDLMTSEDRKILERAVILLREEADGLPIGPVRKMWRRHAARLARVVAGTLGCGAGMSRLVDTSGVDGEVLAMAERESIERVIAATEEIGRNGLRVRRESEDPHRLTYWAFFIDSFEWALKALLPSEPAWSEDDSPSFAEIQVPALYVKPLRAEVREELHYWSVDYQDTPKDHRTRWGYERLAEQLNAAPDDEPATMSVMTGPEGAGQLCGHLLDGSYGPSPLMDIADMFDRQDRATRERGRELLDAYLAVVDQLEAIAA
jgi:hypothetical protein